MKYDLGRSAKGGKFAGWLKRDLEGSAGKEVDLGSVKLSPAAQPGRQ
jgi:hypothetical protein